MTLLDKPRFDLKFLKTLSRIVSIHVDKTSTVKTSNARALQYKPERKIYDHTIDGILISKLSKVTE